MSVRCRFDVPVTPGILYLPSLGAYAGPFDMSGEAHYQDHTINLDSLISYSGRGEHPCTHRHVDGSIWFSSSLEQQESPFLWGVESPQFDPIPGHYISYLGSQKYRSILDIVGQRYTRSADPPSTPYRTRMDRKITSCDVTASHVRLEYFDVCLSWSGGRCYYGYHYSYDLEYTEDKGYIGEYIYSKCNSEGIPGQIIRSDSEYRLPSCAMSLPGSGWSDEKIALTLAGLENLIALELLRAIRLTDHVLSPMDAYAKAIDAVPALDSNNIENAVQACDPSAMFPPVKDIISLIGSPSAEDAIRVSSNLYLWYIYSVKPSVADVRQAYNTYRKHASASLQSLPSGTFRSATHEIRGKYECTCAAKVVCTPAITDSFQKFDSVATNLGLELSLANAWDLVPYSFIADWFCNASSVLTTVDTYLFKGRYAVNSCLTSVKATRDDFWQVRTPYCICDGLTVTSYVRALTAGPPRVKFTTSSLRGVTSTGHTMASGALLVSNL